MTGKSKVVGIRLTAGRLQKYVRAAARDPSRVYFKEPSDRRNLAGELTYRQVLKCLQEGRIIGKPVMDEHSSWRFGMLRHGAGLTVVVDVAALAASARIERLIVLGFEAE